jgi:hypothetical protein
MTELTTEQLIYLLYAKAYAKAAEADTLTRGDVKSYLPNEWKDQAEEIYGDLKIQELIELKTKEGKPTQKAGRFSLTNKGSQVLVTALTTTDYNFTSSKSYKVLNTALTCLLTYIKESVEAHPQAKPSEEMTFDEFQEKFKTLYFEERKQQELRGAVAIYSQKLLQKFTEQNSISQNTLNQYFEMLKTNRKIFTVIEKDHELMEWAE